MLNSNDLSDVIVILMDSIVVKSKIHTAELNRLTQEAENLRKIATDLQHELNETKEKVRVRNIRISFLEKEEIASAKTKAPVSKRKPGRPKKA